MLKRMNINIEKNLDLEVYICIIRVKIGIESTTNSLKSIWDSQIFTINENCLLVTIYNRLI